MLLVPLGIVLLLTGADYLLWSWSLTSGHDLLALFCGLTLAPLTIALLWLALLATARVLRRAASGTARDLPRSAGGARARRRAAEAATAQSLPQHDGEPASVAGPSSSGSIAA